MAKSNTLQAIVEIAGTLSPTLEKSIGGVVNKLDGINVKALAVGAAAGGIAVATTKAVFEAGKALYNLGTRFDEAENTIRAGTGATGDKLEELMGTFDEVYQSIPTSMEDASTAISDWNTRLGVTGDTLQGLSTQAIQVADIMGEDMTGVIEASSQAFKQWNIASDDMGGKMDYIFKVCQDTGMGFDKLMSSMQSSGAVLQDLGYSFDDAATMIANLDKAGINTEQVLKGMKKGLGNIAKDGGDAVAAMHDYCSQIQGAASETEAITIATEIFGSATAVTMAQAIRSGAMDVDELTAAYNANSESIGAAAEDTYTLSERLQLFKQKAEVALEPLAGTILDSLEQLMPVVSDLMSQLLPILGDLAQAIIPIVQDLVPQIAPLLTQLIPPIVSIAGVLASSVIPPIVEIVTSLIPAALSIMSALMPIIQVLIETVLPVLVDIIQQIIPPVVQIVMTLLPVIQQLLTALAPIVTQLFTALSPVLAAAGQLISTLLPPVISLIQTLMPIITTCASIISTVLTVAIQALMPVIDGVISVVSTIASVFEAAFSGLVGIVKTPINAIISLVNKAIGAINSISIDVPDWVPLLGGKHFGFSIPTIPMLATGGFTDGISIAGEAGTEAVISFDQAYRSANIGYWMEAGKMLGVLGESGSLSPELATSSLAGQLLSLDDFSLSELASENNTVIYDFSGMSYNPTVNTTGDGPDIMAQLREAGQEFFDWLEAWIRRKERTAYGY